MFVFVMGAPGAGATTVTNRGVRLGQTERIDVDLLAHMHRQCLEASSSVMSQPLPADMTEERMRILSVETRFKDGFKGTKTIFLDGFPNTEKEAAWLVNSPNVPACLVIELTVPVDEAITRLRGSLEERTVRICARAYEVRSRLVGSALLSVEGKVVHVTVNTGGRSIEDVWEEVAHIVEAHRPQS